MGKECDKFSLPITPPRCQSIIPDWMVPLLLWLAFSIVILLVGLGGWWLTEFYPETAPFQLIVKGAGLLTRVLMTAVFIAVSAMALGGMFSRPHPRV